MDFFCKLVKSTGNGVHFFEGALSAEEIAMINYAKVPENSVVSSPEEFIKGGLYTAVYGACQWLIGANKSERALVGSMFKKVLRR